MSNVIIDETVINTELNETIINTSTEETKVETEIDETIINSTIDETVIETELSEVIGLGGKFLINDDVIITISKDEPEIESNKHLWIKINEV